MTSFVLGVKNIAVNYSENRDITSRLPKSVKVFGQDWKRLSLDYHLLLEVKDIKLSRSNGWISKIQRLILCIKQLLQII